MYCFSTGQTVPFLPLEWNVFRNVNPLFDGEVDHAPLGPFGDAVVAARTDPGEVRKGPARMRLGGVQGLDVDGDGKGKIVGVSRMVLFIKDDGISSERLMRVPGCGQVHPLWSIDAS